MFSGFCRFGFRGGGGLWYLGIPEAFGFGILLVEFVPQGFSGL